MPGTDFLNNPLLWQYLSGVGAAMNQQPWAQAANAITQQNISGQSMTGLMGIFQKMLKGEIPEGAGYKIDSKGMSMSIPKMELDKLDSSKGGAFGPGEGFSLGGTAPNVQAPQANPSPGNVPVPTMPTNLPTVAPQQGGGGDGNMGALAKLLNPSGSLPKIPGSALAGLSTTDISNALSGMLNVGNLDQKKLETLLGMPLQDAQTKLALANAERLREGEPLDRPYPISVPGIGQVTVREWSNLPTEQKQYAAYKNLEKLGEGVDLSYEEFLKEYDKTDREKFLRAAMGDEDLMSAAKDLAKSGRSQINIGQDTLAREQAKQQADVLGPSAESDIRARLKKQDSIKWRGGETAKKIADAEGIPYSEGQKIHQDAMVRMELDKEIRRVLHGQGTVTYKKGKGWFLDGKLVREDI